MHKYLLNIDEEVTYDNFKKTEQLLLVPTQMRLADESIKEYVSLAEGVDPNEFAKINVSSDTLGELEQKLDETAQSTIKDVQGQKREFNESDNIKLFNDLMREVDSFAGSMAKRDTELIRTKGKGYTSQQLNNLEIVLKQMYIEAALPTLHGNITQNEQLRNKARDITETDSTSEYLNRYTSVNSMSTDTYSQFASLNAFYSDWSKKNSIGPLNPASPSLYRATSSDLKKLLPAGSPQVVSQEIQERRKEEALKLAEQTPGYSNFSEAEKQRVIQSAEKQVRQTEKVKVQEAQGIVEQFTDLTFALADVVSEQVKPVEIPNIRTSALYKVPAAGQEKAKVAFEKREQLAEPKIAKYNEDLDSLSALTARLIFYDYDTDFTGAIENIKKGDNPFDEKARGALDRFNIVDNGDYEDELENLFSLFVETQEPIMLYYATHSNPKMWTDGISDNSLMNDLYRSSRS